MKIILLLLCIGAISALECSTTCGGGTDTCYDLYNYDGDASYCTVCDESDYRIPIDPDDYDDGDEIIPFHGTCTDVLDLIVDAAYYTQGDFYMTSYTTFPFGWYKNTADDTVKELVACEATCLSCLGALATDCMACLPEATTNNAMKLQKLKEPHLIGQCVLECSAGYYQSGDECILCHSECVECDGPFRDDCRSCAEVDGEKPVLHVIQPGNTSGFCLESCEYGAYDEDANRCILNGQCDDEMERDGQKCVGGVREDACCSS